MSFGGFVENNSGGGGGGVRNIGEISYNNERMPFGSFSQPRLVTSPALAKSMFNSPGLSLALQTNIDGQEDVNGSMHGNYEQNGLRRSREEEQSRSGSDNLDGVSGDEQDADDKPPRKKRYHRHTPQQIQELESLFKECPHPDEKQRLELSKRLCLETRQVKFWFQNRRTQMKTQLERHENNLLRQENDKLRAENMSIRDAMRNPICSNCGGPAMIGEISLEEQHLRIENARLKDELDRVCALAGKFLGRPISSLPNSSLELGVGGNNNNGFNVMNNVPSTLPDFNSGMSNNPLAIVSPSNRQTSMVTTGFDRSVERSMFLELALAAMDELVKMAQTSDPLWIRSVEGGREILNHEEYMRTFTPCIGLKPNGFVSEASRETGTVIINSLALVETLMDSNRWIEMFPCIIARTSTNEVISNGINGTRNGALQLMQAELHVLSPLVPVREVNFLRFCKQHAEGVWAVVDVSIDTIRETSGATSFVNCRKLPSGCVVQDMPNGYSKVTWVEHTEYEENQVHQLYRPLLSSGMGFGASRWVATLQRQCECLAILMSSAAPSRDHSAITAGGRRSMLKLAQRMTNNFCAGVCASTVHKWNKLNPGNVDEDVRVMTRKSVDDPGEPPGIVLSAATSVWLPVSPQRLFDFLRDERLRSEWDILSNGGPMQEMAHIAKGQDHGNCVSLLRASAMNSNQSSMLILQETCIDEAGSLVVYAPVDIPAMHVVMNGGDSAYVALLPSGFAIVPDGPGSRGLENGDATANGGGEARVSGSLLTVAFQILVNSLPTAKLTVESVETVNNLISCTVQHWHGIRQFGTPWADGTAAISQCAINPGETFQYRFKVDRPGTYFYHGHFGMQRAAGLYGSLIVDLPKEQREPFHYDGEFNLLLSDLWHTSSHEQEVGLSSAPMRWIGEPQSLLINGRGQFNCSLAAKYGSTNLQQCNLKGGEECAPQILHVEPKKTYRIRIASTTSLASLNLAISNHKLIVVEADGNYVHPFAVDDIDIYSGETYSVLLTTDQDPKKNYWLSIGVRGRKPGTPQALTILNYKTISASVFPTLPPPVTPLWNDTEHSKAFTKQIISKMGTPQPPKSSHRTILLLNTQNKIGSFTKWAINNVSLTLPTTPYLGSIKFKLNNTFDRNPPPERFPMDYDIFKNPVNPNTTTGNGVYTFQLNEVVDVILQNANQLNGNGSEIHPWHLHGHDFWVLGYGEGRFRPGVDEKSFNLTRAPLRNTAVIFPYGWTALRFKADNPGVWAFHCHIEPHLHMGMGVIFAEAVHKVRNIPKEALKCGATA